MHNTTLILGAGPGGIAAATALRERAPKTHRVVLVDRARDVTLGATHAWIMNGEKVSAQVAHSRQGLARRGIEFLQAEVQSIDPVALRVVTSTGMLQGDHLVLALGADLNMGVVPGLAEAAHSHFSVAGATALNTALKEFKGGDVVVLVPRTPFKCPPAPYECAMLLHDLFAKRKLRDRVNLSVHTVEGAPMMTAGPELGAFIRGLLEERQITFHPQHKTLRVDGATQTVHFEDGSAAHFDLLVAVPPHEAPAAVRAAGLTNASGFIPVDPRTLAAAHPNVFAIGDVTTVPLPGRYKPDVPLALPKAGIFAERQGLVVGENLAARLAGKPETAVFDGEGYCFVEPAPGVAIKGDVNFFALPHPVARAEPGSAEQYDAKLTWLREWVGRYL